MKGLLKFITCGSVDDGKSTLIGHMLYDAKLIFADQEHALEMDSKIGSNEGGLDYSLLSLQFPEYSFKIIQIIPRLPKLDGQLLQRELQKPEKKKSYHRDYGLDMLLFFSGALLRPDRTVNIRSCVTYA